MEEYMIPCPTKKVIGIDCFGCGTQRAIALILEGKFIEAFNMYPAIYGVLIMIFFTILHLIDKKRSYHKVLLYLGIGNAVIILSSYIYKHFF